MSSLAGAVFGLLLGLELLCRDLAEGLSAAMTWLLLACGSARQDLIYFVF